MKIEQLRFFDAVVSVNSIRGASKKLFTTPQNISRSLKLLEEELGTQLFNRNTKGMELTDNGRKAYDYVKSILHEVDELKNAFGVDQREDTSINIPINIMVNPAMESYISSIYNILTKNYPETPVMFHQERFGLSPDKIIPKMKNIPDLIIVNVKQGDVETFIKVMKVKYRVYFLFVDCMFVQTPKDSVYARKTFITLDELCEMPLMLYNYSPNEPSELNAKLKERGLSLKNVCISGNINTCSLMANNRGKCCLVGYPSVQFRPLGNVEYIPLEDDMAMDYLLLEKRETNNPGYVNAFVELISEHFETRLLAE